MNHAAWPAFEVAGPHRLEGLGPGPARRPAGFFNSLRERPVMPIDRIILGRGGGRMERVLALADPDTALGFQLAGIEVIAPLGEKVEAVFRDLLEKKEPAVVIYNETFLNDLPERLRKRMEDSLRPVFVPVPHVGSWGEGEKREEYLARLLRRAIGYQIKIQK